MPSDAGRTREAKQVRPWRFVFVYGLALTLSFSSVTCRGGRLLLVVVTSTSQGGECYKKKKNQNAYKFHPLKGRGEGERRLVPNRIGNRLSFSRSLTRAVSDLAVATERTSCHAFAREICHNQSRRISNLGRRCPTKGDTKWRGGWKLRIVGLNGFAVATSQWGWMGEGRKECLLSVMATAAIAAAPPQCIVPFSSSNRHLPSSPAARARRRRPLWLRERRSAHRFPALSLPPGSAVNRRTRQAGPRKNCDWADEMWNISQ